MSAESSGTMVTLPDSARRAMLTMKLRRVIAEAEAAEARAREIDIEAAACELRERLDRLVEGRYVGHAERLALARVDAEDRIREARAHASELLDRVPADRATAYAAAPASSDGSLVPRRSGFDPGRAPDTETSERRDSDADEDNETSTSDSGAWNVVP